MAQRNLGARGSGSGSGGGNHYHNQDNGDIELVSSKTLEVCSGEDKSIFYFDLLKQRSRSRGGDRSSYYYQYLKISEKRIDSSNTRSSDRNSSSSIEVPVDGILWFVDLFTYYINCDEHHESEDNKDQSPLPGTNSNRKKSSKPLDLGCNKVFYLDIEKNQTDRLLKITEATSGSRIVVPEGGGSSGQAQGWADFRNILEEINEEATPVVSEEESSKVIRADDKRFFFDLSSNQRGRYLKISEVRRDGGRSYIILPLSGLIQFHQTIAHFVDLTKRIQL